MEVNAVSISGNLVRDPQLNTTQSGVPVANLSIGHNRRVKRGGEYQNEANFFDITVWGKTAEFCADNLKKGDGLIVQGELVQETWDRADGEGKNSKVSVTARVVKPIRKREDNPHAGKPQEKTDPRTDAETSENTQSVLEGSDDVFDF